MRYKQRIPCAVVMSSAALCLFFQVAFALSVKDIPDNQAEKKKIINIVDVVHQHAEPYCRYWKPNWESPALKNTVTTTLYYALSQIDSLRTGADTDFAFSFLCGIIWHHLYQLEVDSAFTKADSIADFLYAMFPERQAEALWLKGINLVKAAQIQQGFRLLENVHTVKGMYNESFLRDYTALSAVCFLPGECINKDSVQLVLLPNKQSAPILFKQDELISRKETWQAVSDFSDSKRAIPTFIFSAEFSFYKPVKIVVHPLRRIYDYTLDVEIRNEEIRPLPLQPLYDPFGQTFNSEIKVIVDQNTPGRSVEESAYEIVWNNFDRVKQVDEPDNFKGISLRCYKRSAFKNTPGEFYAYAVFDKNTYGNCRNFYQPRKNNLPEEPFHLRYIVAMKSSEAVEEKAELIFQDILNKFEREQY